MTDYRPFWSLWALAAVWFALLILFWAWPAIDIGFSHLFFAERACNAGEQAAVCGNFPLAANGLLSALRMVLYYLPVVAAIVLIASITVPALDSKFTWPEASRRNRLIVLAVWVIDAGLIVNFILKAHSGRPRPDTTLFFGGSFPFVPAGDFSGACTSNCSFISGEAASAGWLICLLALAAPSVRRKLSLPVFVLSMATALMRVMFGRHFLSDAVLAWLSAPLVFAIAVALTGWQRRKINP